jgi:hypothetical protein
MLIAYIDESGDTGNDPGRSSKTYTLGCVLVESDTWNTSFDNLIAFRRRLKQTYGVPIRAEVKANYLIRNSGTFKNSNLNPNDRRMIYKAHLNQLSQDSNLRAFGIIIHKTMSYSGKDVFGFAWTTLLQRLERTSYGLGNVPILIVHDEGENASIRKLARWSRRRLSSGSIIGGGSRHLPFSKLLDDPIPKASHESYFLQLADLVAYAAFRRIYAPSHSVSGVVNQNMWDNLGAGVFGAVNQVRMRTAPGIVEVWK